VSYDTDPKALAAIPAEIRRIVEAIPDLRFDRCHFLTYGDTALLFEIVFFTTTPDFNTYADAQQKVNLAIIERLREMKVSFTAPLRAVVVIENSPTRSLT
jgi:small-conductance mechanosensitive channel